MCFLDLFVFLTASERPIFLPKFVTLPQRSTPSQRVSPSLEKFPMLKIEEGTDRAIMISFLSVSSNVLDFAFAIPLFTT